ncbi:hypothetical protein K502DRAFT_349521 [Neoconidiobolus thromboides FSU 785]|nr:hypothetical protein K502DRAFT_349521 [Neoconidiobolus thromboides FSU 785]
MNNPKSVAYGWAALTVAAAFSYIMAKDEIDKRRKAYAHKQEILTWEQRVANEEARLAKEKPAVEKTKENPIEKTTSLENK